MRTETEGTGLLLRHVEVAQQVVDVRVRDGRVVDIGSGLGPASRDELEIDGAGGALLPGLHDHHLHLHALAASTTSVDVGPAFVRSRDDLIAVLRAAVPNAGWIRAIGYHESTVGDLDRTALDAAVPSLPVRVQHRGGALWVLNSVAIHRIGPLVSQDLPGIERDATGEPTGRLWRLDHELQPWLPDRTHEQREALGLVTQRLLRLGLTGVTDATPVIDADGLDLLRSTHPLRLHLLGAPDGAELAPGWSRGARKILLHDHDLSSFDELVDMINRGRGGSERRPVAVHCVTRESLVLTLAALEAAGSCPGDRIEHGAVIPPELDEHLRSLGLTVVTQPDFLRTRGDDYLRDVHVDDHPHLYRWDTLARSGVAVVASSDAPFGEVDPWQVMRSARTRQTSSGAVVGPDEWVDVRTALQGYLTPAAQPGGDPRRVGVGAAADLCLLRVPLADVLAEPDAAAVAAVIVDGRVAWAG